MLGLFVLAFIVGGTITNTAHALPLPSPANLTNVNATAVCRLPQ